jgi:hypothetical protein
MSVRLALRLSHSGILTRKYQAAVHGIKLIFFENKLMADRGYFIEK